MTVVNADTHSIHTHTPHDHGPTWPWINHKTKKSEGVDHTKAYHQGDCLSD